MKLLNKLFSFLYEKNLAAFIGCLLLLSFIWVRFIYKRLPKDIPFDLSLISLLLLVLICMIHIYMIYKILKPSLSSEWKKLLYPIATWLVKPLLQLNQLLLSKKKVRQLLKFLLILLHKLFNMHIVNHNKVYIHALLTIMPRILFIICLIIDCFYFKQLHLIYTCVFIITYPLIIQYLIYVSEIIKAYDTLILDRYFIIEITSEDIVYPKSAYDNDGFLKPGNPTYLFDPSELKYDSFDNRFGDAKEYKYLKTLNFIEYQTDALCCDCLSYEYKILFQEERKDVFFLEKILQPADFNKNFCNDLLKIHINISVLKDNIVSAKEYFSNYYLKLHMVITIITLICWLYILILSLETFHFSDMELIFMQKFKNYIEPFSDTPIIQ